MKKRRIELLVAAAVMLFLAGFIPGFLKARSSDRRAADARERERLYEMRDRLGTAFLQTSLKNYGVALGDLSQFFTTARETASETRSPALRETLEGLLARRDEVTARMGRAAPEAYADVQGMYRALVDQTKDSIDQRPAR